MAITFQEGVQVTPQTLSRLGSFMALDNALPAWGDPPASDETIYIDEMGKGFDSSLEKIRAILLTGDLVKPTLSHIDNTLPSSTEYSFSTSQSEYSKSTNAMVAARGSYGLVRGSGGYSKKTEITSDSYSLHICAFVRRVDPTWVLRSDSIQMHPDATKIFETSKDRYALTRLFGDKVVTGIIPGNEIFIDLKIDTASSSQKTAVQADLKLSYANLASGSGSFTEVIKAAAKAKSVKLSAVGYGGSLDRIPLEENDIQNRMRAVLRGDDGSGIILRYVTQDISNYIMDGVPLDFVDASDNQRRLLAAETYDEMMEFFVQAEVDASYVQENDSEFDVVTAQRAKDDLTTIRNKKAQLNELYSHCVGEFMKTGQGAKELEDVMNFPVLDLQDYPQKVDKRPAKSRRRRPWWKL